MQGLFSCNPKCLEVDGSSVTDPVGHGWVASWLMWYKPLEDWELVNLTAAVEVGRAWGAWWCIGNWGFDFCFRGKHVEWNGGVGGGGVGGCEGNVSDCTS